MTRIFAIHILAISAFLINSCSSEPSDNGINNEKSIPKSEENLEPKLLTKKEIVEFYKIVGNTVLTQTLLDSFSTITFDQVYFPSTFDKTHKDFNLWCAPNLENPHPTLDNWNSYKGDSLMWQNAAIDMLMSEFRLTASVDGIAGVISTIETSKHANSIIWPEKLPDDFNDSMLELSKGFWKSGKVLILADITVFIINKDDIDRFLELAAYCKYQGIIVYDEDYLENEA